MEERKRGRPGCMAYFSTICLFMVEVGALKLTTNSLTKTTFRLPAKPHSGRFSEISVAFQNSYFLQLLILIPPFCIVGSSNPRDEGPQSL